MDTGEFLTRGTIWLTIVAYLVGSVVFALSRRRSGWDSAARIVWTIACLSLIAHFISAFQFYHGWSHQAAYRDTARQTNEAFGFNSGAGLYINYLLLIAWIVDLTWWWLSGLDSYRRRSWPLLVAWHAFLIFIIFNATVIFADGIVRWLGLAVCLGLSFVWLFVVKQSAPKTVEESQAWTR
jgi:hypothetical protein